MEDRAPLRTYRRDAGHYFLWPADRDRVLHGTIRAAVYRHVYHIGDVDEIEIRSSGSRYMPGETDPYHFFGAFGSFDGKIVRGTEAKEIADLWRKLSTGPHEYMCFDPAYGLIFRYRGHEVLKTSICWECQGIALPLTNGNPIIAGFDGNSESVQKLIEVLQKHVPLLPQPKPE